MTGLPPATGAPPPCEVCGQVLRAWPLSAADVLWRCPACGHVQRDLALAPAGARAPAYGGDPGLDRVRLALTHRRLTSAAPPGGDRRVFEIGYGSGALLRRFLDAGASVGGADRGALQVVVDPVVAAAPGVRATAFPDDRREDGDYDLVYAVHVLEHVVDVHALVAAAAALLRPGGRLAVITPAGDSSGLRRYGAAWWMLEDPTHVRFFSASSLRRLLRAHGLVDVAVTRPVTDSLSVEAATAERRRLAGRLPQEGVLGLRRTQVRVVVGLPAVLLRRALRPGSRPVLLASARRPG